MSRSALHALLAKRSRLSVNRAPSLLLTVVALMFVVVALLIAAKLTSEVYASAFPQKDLAGSAATTTPGRADERGLTATATGTATVASATVVGEALEKTLEKHPPGAGQPVSEKDSPKDVLANALGALGVVVAAVTVLLTIGTAWHAGVVEATNRKLQVVAEYVQIYEKDQKLQASLHRAQRELAAWLGRQGLNHTGDLIAQYSLALSTLSTHDRELRFHAYYELRGPLLSHQKDLPQVASYCLQCHEQAVARLAVGLPDRADLTEGPLSARQVQKEVDQGLWCLLFDPAEHHRLHRTLDPEGA